MTPAPLAPEHRDVFVQAHREVFASKVDTGWFDWKYAKPANPGWALWDGAPGASPLVAHCGGIARTLLDRGRPRAALQIGDVMVRAPWRRAARRSGAFFRVSDAFYAHHLGPGRHFEWGFGFPSHRHLKLAMALGLLQDAGPMMSAVWPAASVHVPRANGAGGTPVAMQGRLGSARTWLVQRLADGAVLRQALAGAWRSMRSDASAWVLGERSPETVLWRHLQKPTAAGQWPAQFWAVQRAGRSAPVGVVIVGPGAGPTAAHWLDWVGPPRMLPLGLQAAREAAACAGCSEVHAWLSAGPWRLLGPSATLAQREVARIGIPSASSLSAQEAINCPWWFMGADTDFL